MSTTTAHPSAADAAPQSVAAPSAAERPLPVLAVDLVTEPALLGGLAELARDLEQAGVGALTLSDGGLHPIHVAAHLAPLTSSIGLLPRTDAVYVEPFHLATQLMSLDHLSHGRAGWLLRAETDPEVAATVGRTVLDLAATAREAADVLETARLLWDSWAPDAVVRDVASGTYVDAARLQYVDVEAETFSVRGPAITPRSPQGLLPVLLADTDRAAAGERTAERADGRVLDLDLSSGLTIAQAAVRIREALAAVPAPGSSAEGGAVLQDPADSGAAPDAAAVRLVRLVGLDLEADPLGTVAGLTADLRSEGLIAPAPTPGQDLRTRLGLSPAPFRLDPARRSDRARLSREESA
ncbi:LLM class flavin-dependent oxidoreductase [Brachybacterium sp.]|uniref:LLM class flavin-dependent oxidoreductase n=1 Tax=Brachybacterium sp. TaxID=1891286 RepID=UPI003F926036